LQRKLCTILVLTLLFVSCFAGLVHVKQAKANGEWGGTYQLWNTPFGWSNPIFDNSSQTSSDPFNFIVDFRNVTNIRSDTDQKNLGCDLADQLGDAAFCNIYFTNDTTEGGLGVSLSILCNGIFTTFVVGINITSYYVYGVFDGATINFYDVSNNFLLEATPSSTFGYVALEFSSESNLYGINDGSLTLRGFSPIPPTVSYGFRVWLLHSNGVETELTSGTPIALLNLTEDYVGYLSNTWTAPTTAITLGYDVLKVQVYLNAGTGEYVARAAYLSPVLMANYIYSSDWVFTLYVNRTGTSVSFSFGEASHRSGVSGLTFDLPLDSQIQLWRLTRGDVIGFVIGGYYDVIGEGVYLLILFAICGSLYRRYGHFGPIAVFFILFAGPGGILLLVIPEVAIIPAAILFIIGCTAILWRIIR
jgi:hypothetical protein